MYRVAARYGVSLAVVSNTVLQTPDWPELEVERVVVGNALDAADDWIAEQVKAGDLVLTADIPLAARALEAGARALDFRGGEFDVASIGTLLASRDLNAHLRSAGMFTGGPSSPSKKDNSQFASKLDNAVSLMAKRSTSLE